MSCFITRVALVLKLESQNAGKWGPARLTPWMCTQAFWPPGVDPNTLMTGTLSMVVPSNSL